MNLNGGERGIRTLAPLTQSNPLAEGPLIATWVSLQIKLFIQEFDSLKTESETNLRLPFLRGPRKVLGIRFAASASLFGVILG